mgnify:CR=1 FL=1
MLKARILIKAEVNPNMEQTTQKREYENKPVVETQLSLSKDGKYFLHKTIITDIKPVNYLKKVLERKE